MSIPEKHIAPSQLKQISENEWILPGSTLLSDVSNFFDIEFQPRGRYKTIAGFIMTELGNIPKEGDKFRIYGYTFTVLTKERMRIVNVRIEKPNNKEDKI